MKLLLPLICVLMCIPGLAQVKVKGYTRKDGTYVQPHYRSKPDGNPYNNWSYPGNTNPYTGKTATGSPEAYLNNYYKNNSTSTSNTNTTTRQTAPPYYRYETKVEPGYSPPLRLSPRDNSDEIYRCSPGEVVYILDDAKNDYYEVEVHGFTGYLSKKYIQEVRSIQSTRLTATTNQTVNLNPLSSGLEIVYKPTPPANYWYEAKVDTGYNRSLRLSPRDNSSELYRCRPGEIVYVLDNTENDYCKVVVHGFTGYLSEKYIVK